MSNRTVARVICLVAIAPTVLALLAACGPAATTTPAPPTDVPIPPTAEPLPTQAPAAESDTWIKTYGGRGDDVANGMLLADDGGYFVVGGTNLKFDAEMQGDIYLIRTDAAGEVLWEKTYGGEGYRLGQSISRAKDGGLLISGVTASPGSGGMDIFLTKLDQDGNELWTKTFGGPLDEFGAAWPLEDGGYLLGGNLVDPNDVVADPGAAGYGGFAGRSNVYLARTDGDGDELWSRTFGGENNVMSLAAAPSPDGGFLVLATIMHYPENDDDIYLLKVDEDGNEVWSRTWEEERCTGRDLISTTDGNYLLTGIYSLVEGTDRPTQDFLFIKVDPDGNELWRSTFGDPDKIDYASVLAEAADGGYVAAGNRGTSLSSWDEDLVLVKIDENGQLLWERVIETNSHNMFGAILCHPDGGYLIAGSTYGNGGFDIFLVKTDAEGNVEH